MFGSVLRAVLLIVIVVAVVVGIGAFFLGYRAGDARTGDPPAVGTSGGNPRTGSARERGAEIGERVGERIGAAADTVGEAFSDGTITAKIKSKMALDDAIKASDINVSTSDRVVTLSGKVRSASERERALQLARETEGVKSVNDQLRMGR